MNTQIWFRAKRYGWGWTPCTWQGWLLTFGYIGIILLLGLTIDNNSSMNEAYFRFILPIILITIAFIWICYKKGEKPGWRWGSKR